MLYRSNTLNLPTGDESLPFVTYECCGNGVTLRGVLSALGDSANHVRAHPDTATPGKAHPDDSFFSISDMDARVDPTSTSYRPYGPLYLYWLTTQCTKYAHIGVALHMAPDDLKTVQGAEVAATVMLNAKIESVNNKATSMCIETLFDKDLHKDTTWQEQAGVEEPDEFQVASTPGSRC
jgi:hypothetical protein